MTEEPGELDGATVRKLQICPADGLSTASRGAIVWSPMGEADGSGGDATVVAGKLILACIAPGVKRRQFIDSIASMARGSVYKSEYRGRFYQGDPEAAARVHALAALLTDAEDGDLFIIDVDVPYYSRVLEEGTPDDDSDGDIVDDWNVSLKLIERCLSTGRNVGFVIVTTAFDDRLLPNSLLDYATVRLGVGGLGPLQCLTLFGGSSKYKAGVDDAWVAGDPLIMQVAAGDHWLGLASLDAPDEIRAERRRLRERSADKPLDAAVGDDAAGVDAASQRRRAALGALAASGAIMALALTIRALRACKRWRLG